jgi:two-component system, NarL family, nitrate/nitrite response regulator NarL
VTDSQLTDLIRRGSYGVFMKHGSPAALIQGIRGIVEGKPFIEENLLRRAFQEARAGETDQSSSKLSEREKQVLSYVFEGLANKQIADRLQLSETAVKSSLQRLFAKTGVRTRSQLVRVALEQYRYQL